MRQIRPSSRIRSMARAVRLTVLFGMIVSLSGFAPPVPNANAHAGRIHRSQLPSSMDHGDTPSALGSPQPILEAAFDFEGVQTTKLIPADLAAGDEFGYAMAQSGTTLVVGARHANAVYVFTHNPATNTWQQVAKLGHELTSSYTNFGQSVAIDGDTIVVGSGGHADAPNEGTAYVYERTSGGPNHWGLVRVLRPSNSSSYELFSYAVAISGDTIVAGAAGNSGQTTTDRGAVFVYERNQGGANNWGEATRLTAGNGTAWERFGLSVAIEGNRMAIGAPRELPYTLTPGSVYVFERDPATRTLWHQQARLAASDSSDASGDAFGTFVALAGDTIAALAEGTNAIYIYHRNAGGDTTWNDGKKLTINDIHGTGRFTRALTLHDDRLVVGVQGYGEYNRLGAVYVFDRNAGGANAWGMRSRLVPQNNLSYETLETFGSAIVFAGDDVLVGAAHDDDTGLWSGSAFAFRLYPRPLLADDAHITNEDTVAVIDVLANDRAPTGTGSLDPTSVAVIQEPTHGTANVDLRDGTITYTPTLDFQGTDQFVYAATTTVGTSQSASVTVTVRSVNDAPTFTSATSPTAIARNLYGADVAARDVDAGDVLTITAPLAPAWLTLTATGSGTARLSGTPTDADVGEQAVHLVVTDSGGASTTQAFTITVAPNAPPTFSTNSLPSAVAWSPYGANVAAYDSDSVGVLTITAILTPTWLTVTATGTGTARLSGTPVDADVGAHPVRLAVTGSDGASSTQTFTITVAPNTPPRFPYRLPTHVRAGKTYSASVVATDPDPGQAVTITARRLPAWLQLTTDRRGVDLLTGTPDHTDVGEHLVDLQATDPGGLITTEVFTITVEPDIPNAPKDVVAAALSSSAVQLKWVDASTDERGFHVERRSSNEEWATVATLDAGVTSYADSGLSCGTVYTYRVRSFNQHWESVPSNTVQTSPSEITQRSFDLTRMALTIPSSGLISTTLQIDDPGRVADVNVHVTLDHIYTGDLLISLTAPDGTVVKLTTYNGGPGHDYLGTTFDDEASRPIWSDYAPFSGSYQPQSALHTLYGKPLAGQWTLTVRNSGRFVGTLQHGGLTIAATTGCSGVPSSATPTATPPSSPTPPAPSSPTPTQTVVSAVVPRVASITKRADTEDSPLSEGEVVQTNIAYLSVTFTTDISTFRSALLLIAEGDQPGFQTTSCARLSLHDTFIRSNFRSFSYVNRTITFGYLSSEPLPDGQYRFIVCDTVTGTYPLLDGDDDGQAGGDLIRAFSIQRGTPQTTATPTSTSEPTLTPTATAITPTATPTATAITPTATPTVMPSTPTQTPQAGPQLSLDAADGQPGSSFMVTAKGFTPAKKVAIAVNGVAVGNLTTDVAGAVTLVLETASGAASGFYELSLIGDDSPTAQGTDAQRATGGYWLRRDAPLRTHPADTNVMTVTVPTTIVPRDGTTIYLPLMTKASYS